MAEGHDSNSLLIKKIENYERDKEMLNEQHKLNEALLSEKLEILNECNIDLKEKLNVNSIFLFVE